MTTKCLNNLIQIILEETEVKEFEVLIKDNISQINKQSSFFINLIFLLRFHFYPFFD